MKNRETLSAVDKCVTSGDRVFYAINGVITGLFMILVLLPLINIVASSFSSPSAVNSGRVYLWPVDFSLTGYKKVFAYAGLWRSYLNTFVYTISGSAINIVLTILAAYPLTRRTLPFRNAIMALFVFTMLFSGGMIPSYLVVRDLGMINTIWAMILPGALSVYNTIIARTFIQGLPDELWEAAMLDGCSDLKYLLKVVIPLSATLISVLTLFYAVGHWNEYFKAFLYLTDRDLLPLQLILREVLIANRINFDSITDGDMASALAGMADLLKYSLIIVSSLPILILYPFMQKYFVKGVMVGSLKG